MKNYVQRGEVLEVTGPTGGVSSGDPFMINDLSLVASTDIDEDAKGNAAAEGVFDLPVAGQGPSAAAAVAFGDNVYMDAGTINVDGTNGTLFGKALGAVASGATATIPVRLSN